MASQLFDDVLIFSTADKLCYYQSPFRVWLLALMLSLSLLDLDIQGSNQKEATKPERG